MPTVISSRPRRILAAALLTGTFLVTPAAIADAESIGAATDSGALASSPDGSSAAPIDLTASGPTAGSPDQARSSGTAISDPPWQGPSTIPEPGGLVQDCPGTAGPGPCFETPWTLTLPPDLPFAGSSGSKRAPNGDYEYESGITQQDCQTMLQLELNRGIRAYCQYHPAPDNNWSLNYVVPH